MKVSNTISEESIPTTSKLADIGQLYKIRLSVIVVLSAILSYLMGAETINWLTLLELTVGGILLTGASNAFNQIWEKDLDKLMIRTAKRPLPDGRMEVKEAFVWAFLSGILGVGILWVLVNPICGILGLIAILLYVLVYTPLKRISPIAVFVGAIPGAIPPMLGYVAATSTFNVEPGSLFAVQFMWQFPHFWAIAWVAQEDYLRAGYKLLPFREGRTKRTAFHILVYTLLVIPVSMMPWVFPIDDPMITDWAMILAVLLGIAFSWYSFKLYGDNSVKNAKKLMFASFFYLPLVQIVYVLGKI